MTNASPITNPVPYQRLARSGKSDDLQRRVALSLSAVRRELGELRIWAQDGTIRLCGKVSSFYLRQLALSAACRVAGVRHIIDDMDVSIPKHHLPISRDGSRMPD